MLSHWFVVSDNFSHSTTEFYAEVEKELAARQVPGLTMTRVDFSEGGALSDKRTYLRMIRERLVFDVCAAPFGRAYFFSLRFAEIPPQVAPWQLALCFFAPLLILGLLMKVLGFFAGLGVFVAAGFGLVYLLRNAIALGLEDLDTTLVQSPIFGAIYERYFRAETYYRHDTRLLYHTIVSEVVHKMADETTAAKGVKLVRAYEHNPILDGLYRPVTIPSNS